MHYEEKSVGNIQLPEGSPTWLSQLAGSVAHVSRDEFLSRIESLVDKVKNAGRERAIAQARQLVANNGLKMADVFPRRGQKGNLIGRVAVEPKYRDPTTGKTWTGRGKAPHWIAGKERDHFLI